MKTAKFPVGNVQYLRINLVMKLTLISFINEICMCLICRFTYYKKFLNLTKSYIINSIKKNTLNTVFSYAEKIFIEENLANLYLTMLEETIDPPNCRATNSN